MNLKITGAALMVIFAVNVFAADKRDILITSLLSFFQLEIEANAAKIPKDKRIMAMPLSEKGVDIAAFYMVPHEHDLTNLSIGIHMKYILPQDGSTPNDFMCKLFIDGKPAPIDKYISYGERGTTLQFPAITASTSIGFFLATEKHSYTKGGIQSVSASLISDNISYPGTWMTNGYFGAGREDRGAPVKIILKGNDNCALVAMESV